MSKLKYVVLSDMHLGAENSLLTNLVSDGYETDNSKASPVLIGLVNCLKEIIAKNPAVEKPTLILNGDLMELALTTANEASMAFQRFVELTMPERESEQLFKPEFIFLPGNHDHNLWECSRYEFFVKNLTELKPHDRIKRRLNTTEMFNPPPIQQELLTTLMRMYPHLSQACTKVAYPSFAIKHEEQNKVCIFSHGHYIESIYSLMTTADQLFFPDRISPTTFNELEVQNFAWVDFFWSTLGRSGTVGRDVQLVYDKLQSPARVKELIRQFSKSISKKKKSFIGRWIEEKVLYGILDATIVKVASGERDESEIFTKDFTDGLEKFIELYVRNQIDFELHGNMPKDTTFIFGHTHKPFEKDINYPSFFNKVKVYNSGGWVVDTLDSTPNHGGSIILVDDDLDTVSLNLYKEGDYKPKFAISGPDEHKPFNGLYEHLSKSIDFTSETWVHFTRTVELEVELRYKYLREIIDSNSI